MNRVTTLLLLVLLTSLHAFSQSDFKKTARISGGIGLGGVTKNLKTHGQSVWIQLSYQVSKNFSIATEFENLAYKQPGYYKELPVDPNEILGIDNDFSFLVKYHIPLRQKLIGRLASGWTYMIRQIDYYIYEKNGTSESWYRNISSISDYRIPLLIEIEYPISGGINIQARAKYHLSANKNNNTYSGGIGVSLQL